MEGYKFNDGEVKKRNVKNKVGYVRYSLITLAPVIKSLEHFEDLRLEELLKDLNRLHYNKDAHNEDYVKWSANIGIDSK